MIVNLSHLSIQPSAVSRQPSAVSGQSLANGHSSSVRYGHKLFI
ncbi:MULTISPECIES: hypothetical protein [unclassified Moorena]|nr:MULTISPECIES: hypothetical protein [unclassified Moorena]